MLLNIFSIFLFILSGCQKTMGKTELLSFLNDPANKLVATDSSSGFSYSVYFKPADLIAAGYLSRPDSSVNIDSLRKAHKDYLYFNLCVSYQGSDLFARQIPGVDFGELQKRVSFGMEPYITLKDNGGKQYNLVNYSYARLYAMTTSTNIMLVFKNDASETPQHYELTVKDFVTGTPEQFSFTFYKADIIKSPELNFDLIL